MLAKKLGTATDRLPGYNPQCGHGLLFVYMFIQYYTICTPLTRTKAEPGDGRRCRLRGAHHNTWRELAVSSGRRAIKGLSVRAVVALRPLVPIKQARRCRCTCKTSYVCLSVCAFVHPRHRKRPEPGILYDRQAVSLRKFRPSSSTWKESTRGGENFMAVEAFRRIQLRQSSRNVEWSQVASNLTARRFTIVLNAVRRLRCVPEDRQTEEL